MKDFKTWIAECKVSAADKPEKPDEKNKLGGFDPDTPERKKMYKKVDLITLPEGIPGTNCGNCRFNEDGFCDHKEVMDYVTIRMCRARWDNERVKRSWGKEQA